MRNKFRVNYGCDLFNLNGLAMQTTSHHLTEEIILWSQTLLEENESRLNPTQRESIQSILQSAQDFLHVWCKFYDEGISQPRLALILRESLTVIMGYAVLLKEGMEGELT